MAVTLTGSAGVQFSITQTDSANATGSTSGITFQTDTAVRTLTFTDASKVCAFTGSVGTVGTTIDLYALADANDGTYYMRLSRATASISLATALCIVIHNKSAGAITVAPGASNSFLTASEQITLDAGQAVMLAYGTAKTVDATHRNIKLTGASTDYDCEIYVLGN